MTNGAQAERVGTFKSNSAGEQSYQMRTYLFNVPCSLDWLRVEAPSKSEAVEIAAQRLNLRDLGLVRSLYAGRG